MENSENRYRSGIESLQTREHKKLTEKTNWFRRWKGSEERIVEEREQKENRIEMEKTTTEKIKEWEIELKEGNDEIEEKEPDELLKIELPKAVIFVPSTENSQLAKEIRSVITQLKPWTGISLKVVERAGQKLEEILHRSDPWENYDCGREECNPCKSAYKSEKPRFGNCKRRSVIYRVWCNTCKVKSDKVEKNPGERERNVMKTIKVMKYSLTLVRHPDLRKKEGLNTLKIWSTAEHRVI